MREKIKNRDELLSHGDAESRRIVLDITEKTLRRLDAYERIKSIARMEGAVLGPAPKAPCLSAGGRQGVQPHGHGGG